MSKTTSQRIRLGIVAAALTGAAVLVSVHVAADASGRVAFAPGEAPIEAGADIPHDTGAGTDVHVDIDGFANWALLDRATGGITGDNLTAVSTPQSMIKPWLVADYLRRADTDTPGLLSEASAAIRISDDDAAQTIYEVSGGDASIERLITGCGLTDTTVVPGRWSMTGMSVRDAARMGECVADGRAAGSWTDWLLTEMRNVEGGTSAADQRARSGGGRWGIIDGLPEPMRDEVAIKNGWTRMADGHWDLNCLAVHDDWVLAVMLGYPNERGLDYGADRCRDIAAQLFG